MAGNESQEGAPQIVWDAGVHLDGTILWFDPTKARNFAALTSAATPITDRQKRFLWGDRTARLVSVQAGRRFPGLVTPYGRAFSMGNLDIQLFPSGYMAGAAQIQVTLDGHRYVYSGPISMRHNKTSEPIEIRKCDTLILDATLGHERHVIPARKPVDEQICAWARDVLERSLTPVILVDSPGPAHELLQMLGAHDFSLRVHRSIYAWNKGYRALGIDLPACTQFRGHPPRKDVLVWPTHLRRSPGIRKLRKARFAAVSGTAADKGDARRLRVGVVFPWTPRAGFDDLKKYVKKAAPRQVITIGTHAVEFAETLRAAGTTAEALLPSPQLDLL
ncbi:MAG: putative mRNA 3-end processing factor [Myxococcota bacterium]|jgi:putative mRNA 3-end processing factor